MEHPSSSHTIPEGYGQALCPPPQPVIVVVVLVLPSPPPPPPPPPPSPIIIAPCQPASSQGGLIHGIVVLVLILVLKNLIDVVVVILANFCCRCRPSVLICLLPSFVDCCFERQTESSLPPMASLSSLRRLHHHRRHGRPRNRLSQGGQQGQIVVIVSASPSSLATYWRAETCNEGPSVVSADALVAYGNNGLLLWRVGPKWLQPIV